MMLWTILAVCGTILTATGPRVLGVPIGYYIISVLMEQADGLGDEPSQSTQP